MKEFLGQVYHGILSLEGTGGIYPLKTEGVVTVGDKFMSRNKRGIVENGDCICKQRYD